MPEKYFTPASVLLVHESSLSTVTDAGAPRPGWKITFHEPSSVASCVSTSLGKVRDIAVVGLRNTTNTVPQGSKCSGTVVRPPAILYEAGSDLPVSAYHNSG